MRKYQISAFAYLILTGIQSALKPSSMKMMPIIGHTNQTQSSIITLQFPILMQIHNLVKGICLCLILETSSNKSTQILTVFLALIIHKSMKNVQTFTILVILFIQITGK